MRQVLQKLLLKRLKEDKYELDPMEFARPTIKVVFIPAIGDWVVRVDYHIYGYKKSKILREEELFLFLTGAKGLQDL